MMVAKACFEMTRSQPCKYCLFYAQMGSHNFKTRLQG